MSFGMNVASFVRRYGRQPDRLYNQEAKLYRKLSNRKHRKLANSLIRSASDADDILIPPSPRTEGWLTI